jgi:flagellar biosynthetic protein FlhB
MGEIRKNGQLFLSNDVVQVVTLLVGFVTLKLMWQPVLQNMQYLMIKSYSMISRREPLGSAELRDGFIRILILMAPHILGMVAITGLAASLAVLLQTNWNIKEKKVDFRWSFLNPIGGIQRIFSIQGAIATGKALIKLGLILPVGYFSLVGYYPQMLQLSFLPLEGVFAFAGTALSNLFWKVFYILLALAIFDYFYGKFQWLKVNKMTQEEVKDERKAVEGDETVKRKITQKGLSRIAQRIFQSVPKADVVITNPTHYSVAIQYDRRRMNAPVVVAKGKGYVALRIREIAKEHNVPILERKTLARALYSSTKVGSEIPHELFKATAEVLAYVYRLKSPRSSRQQQDGQR